MYTQKSGQLVFQKTLVEDFNLRKIFSVFLNFAFPFNNGTTEELNEVKVSENCYKFLCLASKYFKDSIIISTRCQISLLMISEFE